MCKIIAVCISEKKGETKKEVLFIECLVNFGIKKDAHSGNWHRQISLLDKKSIDKFKKLELGIKLENGDFAENIITEGIDFKKLSIGSRLIINDEVILEITQKGKKCHSECIIKEKTGKCIMPTKGVFAKVIKGGFVEKGNSIKIIKNV